MTDTERAALIAKAVAAGAVTYFHGRGTFEQSIEAALDAVGFFSPAQDGWQPIETAPRDGTVILLAQGSPWFSVAAGRWWPENPDEGERYPWWVADDCNDDLVNGWQKDCPTHWRPLPAPPSTEMEGES